MNPEYGKRCVQCSDFLGFAPFKSVGILYVHVRCLDAYESGRSVRFALGGDPVTAETFIKYVVCNRLLNPETNEHCEFDGDVDPWMDGSWDCPACGAKRWS